MTDDELQEAWLGAANRRDQALQLLDHTPWWRILRRWSLWEDYKQASFECQSLEMYAR